MAGSPLHPRKWNHSSQWLL